MRILWLHSHFLNWMGGQKYVLEVSKRISKKHNITVYTSCSNNFAKTQFKQSGVKFLSPGFQSTNSPFYWLFLENNIIHEVNQIKKEVRKFDYVISSYFPMHIVAQLLHKPYIQICYEPLAFFYDKDFLNGFNHLVRAFYKIMKFRYGNMDKLALRRAKNVLTISQYNKTWITQVYGRNDIRIIYEGVDTKFFKPTTNKYLQSRFNNKRIILHSTDFTPIKGTDLLIRALPAILKEFPDCIILITSTLNNPQKMMKLSEDLGVRDNIIYLGNVDYDLLPSYYTLADVVVQPTRNQSMSLTVKEAMACQRPVVTGLEATEVIDDGIDGLLVNSSDIKKLSKTVTYVLRNKKEALNLARKARQKIVKKFNWDQVTESIIKTLEIKA